MPSTHDGAKSQYMVFTGTLVEHPSDGQGASVDTGSGGVAANMTQNASRTRIERIIIGQNGSITLTFFREDGTTTLFAYVHDTAAGNARSIDV